MRRVACLALFFAAALAAAAANRPGWLGLSFSFHKNGNATFLQLCAVAPSGPAARAGLRARDVITHIDGKRVAFVSDKAALRHFATIKPNGRIKLRVSRATRSFDATIVAAPMTDDQYRVWQLNGGGR